jgi:DNA gyrase/topoisomerase IV subunit A
MARFGLDEDQANAVLDLMLGQLTEDARIEFETESKNLRAERARLDTLVNSPTKLRRQVGTELDEVAKLFEGDVRRTIIANEILVPASKAAFVLVEPATVTLFGDGTVVSARNGNRGKAPKTTALPIRSFETSTGSSMVAVTAGGKLFRAMVGSMPADKPTAAVNVFRGADVGDLRRVGETHRRPGWRRPQGRHLDHQTRTQRAHGRGVRCPGRLNVGRPARCR